MLEQFLSKSNIVHLFLFFPLFFGLAFFILDYKNYTDKTKAFTLTFLGAFFAYILLSVFFAVYNYSAMKLNTQMFGVKSFEYNFGANSLNIFLEFLLFLVFFLSIFLKKVVFHKLVLFRFFFPVLFIFNLAIFSADIFTFFIFEELLCFIFIIWLTIENKKGVQDFFVPSFLMKIFAPSIFFMFVLLVFSSKEIFYNGKIDFTLRTMRDITYSSEVFTYENLICFFILIFFSLFRILLLSEKFKKNSHGSLLFSIKAFLLTEVFLLFYFLVYFIYPLFYKVLSDFQNIVVLSSVALYSSSLIYSVKNSFFKSFPINAIFLIYIGAFLNTATSLIGALSVFPLVMIWIILYEDISISRGNDFWANLYERIPQIYYLLPFYLISHELFSLSIINGALFFVGFLSFYFMKKESIEKYSDVRKNDLFRNMITSFLVLIMFYFLFTIDGPIRNELYSFFNVTTKS